MHIKENAFKLIFDLLLKEFGASKLVATVALMLTGAFIGCAIGTIVIPNNMMIEKEII